MTQAAIEQMHAKLAAKAAAPDEPYWQMVERLFKEMGSPSATLIHAAVGMTGECGEILLAHVNNDHPNMLEELGDFRFYLQKVLHTFGWSIGSFDMPSCMPDFSQGSIHCLIISACDVQDLLKKQWVYEKPLDGKIWFETVGKLVNAYHAYITEWCFSDKLICDANQYKLSTGPKARYPLGYSDAAAIARADKIGEDCADQACPPCISSEPGICINNADAEMLVDAIENPKGPNAALAAALDKHGDLQTIEAGCVGDLDAVIGQVRPA